jgi:hypothetical protein
LTHHPHSGENITTLIRARDGVIPEDCRGKT